MSLSHEMRRRLGIALRSAGAGDDFADVIDALTGAGGTQADLIFDAATEKTIASGAITCTQASHTVDTEGDAASDNLDTISGMAAEEVVLLRPASGARTVVLRDNSVGSGNVYTPGRQSISLAEATDWALAVSDGTNVVILAYRTQALGGGGIGAALASIANGLGASLVGVEDTATWYATAQVEAALAEVAVAIGGTNSTTRNYSSNGYVADNDTVTVAVGKLDAAIKNYQDQFVVATVTVPDTGGGGTAALATVSLKRAEDNATDPATICTFLLVGKDAQYEPMGSVTLGSCTFGTATTGSIVASGTGWCLCQSDAAGDFACTITDTVDETLYFVAQTAEGMDNTGHRCVVVASNSDSAAWSA